ncbi:MAG: DUF1998 domain-containing protein [Planctomycetes bacterium]|nr:DUF1998 domain-containing protein [Planctomycetota bacterium]
MSSRPAVTTPKIGEIRPSQFLFTFGIGAIVDLPHLSVMVMGVDDWDLNLVRELREGRLLAAVRREVGDQVERLGSPPVAEDSTAGVGNPFNEGANIGIPVAPFPRWMRCPRCELLSPLGSGLFKRKLMPHWNGGAEYVHENCPRVRKPPRVLPARFLVACVHGHLDDFPWIEYVHQGTECKGQLRLWESGLSGAVHGVMMKCDLCSRSRSMADAFGEDADKKMPNCRGRRPHLRDFEESCNQRMKGILLGASNSWFPITLSALSLPEGKADRLAELVREQWGILKNTQGAQNITLLRQIGQLSAFTSFGDEEVAKAVESERPKASVPATEGVPDLLLPEWEAFSNPTKAPKNSDFLLREEQVPASFQTELARVVLVERLREVRALIGFTRVESPGDHMEVGQLPPELRAPISRGAPTWVPATEVRGEGIFIQFREEVVAGWCGERGVLDREADFLEAHKRWRIARGIADPSEGFPGIRYVLLHSLAHALMRQIAIECGYAAAGIRERIYSRGPEEEHGPMAGVLLYTAAPDSEGTLGGLVNLGRPAALGRHLYQALDSMRLCASDPLCAEHHPWKQGVGLHGAACHACLFSPETSCERGNKYLDRWVLVPTVVQVGAPFFRDGGPKGE